MLITLFHEEIHEHVFKETNVNSCQRKIIILHIFSNFQLCLAETANAVLRRKRQSPDMDFGTATTYIRLSNNVDTEGEQQRTPAEGKHSMLHQL